MHSHCTAMASRSNPGTPQTCHLLEAKQTWPPARGPKASASHPLNQTRPTFRKPVPETESFFKPSHSTGLGRTVIDLGKCDMVPLQAFRPAPGSYVGVHRPNLECSLL